METLFGLGGLAVLIAAALLFVLGILMPWFVYRTSVYAREIRDAVRALNPAAGGGTEPELEVEPDRCRECEAALPFMRLKRCPTCGAADPRSSAPYI